MNLDLFLRCTVSFLFLYQTGFTQLAVQLERHHKVVFQNEYIRLIDLTVEPGDTTEWHVHTEPSVVVFLAESSFAIKNLDGPPVIANVSPGQSVYRNYDEKIAMHIVWSEKGTTFRCLVTEILQSPLGKVPSQPIPGGLQWEERVVRSYRFDLDNFKGMVFPKSDGAYLLINVSGTIDVLVAGKNKLLKTNEFIFCPPQESLNISGSTQHAAFVLLQLKSRE